MSFVVPALIKKQSIDILFTMEGLELELRGVIRWMKKESTIYGQAEYHVGVLLIDPPEEYQQLVEGLLEETVPQI